MVGGDERSGAMSNDDSLQRRVDELEARLLRLEAALAARGEGTPPAAARVDAMPHAGDVLPTQPEPESARREPAARPPATPASTAPWPAPPPLPDDDATASSRPFAASESTARSSSASPPPRTSLAAQQAARSGGRDLERFLGLAVLGRVGIAAVVLAAAYFGQLGWTHLGPAARTAVIYAGGGLFVGLGFALRTRVLPRYTALLWGGGVALCWLAGVLGCLRFEVLPRPLALVLMLASTALGQWLARLSGQQAMASVALAGAYAAPVLVGNPSPTPTAFFLLLLLLHTWAAWIHHRWQWWTCRLLAVVATSLLVVGWYWDGPSPTFWSFVGHLELVWLGLAAPELLAALRRRSVDLVRAVPIGLGAFAVHLALLVFGLTSHDAPWFHLLPAASLLALGAAVRRHDEPFGTWLARPGSLLLPLASFWFVFPWGQARDFAAAPHELLAVAAAGGLLFVWRRWTGVAELGAAFAAVLLWVPVTQLHAGELTAWPYLPVVLVPSLAMLLGGHLTFARAAGLVLAQVSVAIVLQPNGDLSSTGSAESAITLSLVGALATLAVWLAARRSDRLLLGTAVTSHAVGLVVWLSWVFAAWLQTRDTASAATMLPLWNLRTGAVLSLVALSAVGFRTLASEHSLPRVVLAGTALIGLYVGGLLEVLDVVAAWSFGPRAVASSLYSLAFAGVLLGIGFWRSLVPLRWTALCMLVVVVGKVLLHDLREVDTPMRVLASGVLGGVLLLAAWGYARRQQAGAPPPG